MRKIKWRYAIGELIIITIGISLAFALNQWSADKKDQRKAESYIDNLIVELKQDQNQLDSNILEIERRINFMNEFLPHLHRDLPGREKMAMGIYKVIDPITFRENQTTWHSLEYSGDMHLISDLEIRNNIIRHYETYEVVEKERERHYNFSKDYLAPFFMKEVNFTSMAREDYPHMKDNYFSNLMYAMRGIYDIQLKAHIKARESALGLIAKLEEFQRNSA